ASRSRINGHSVAIYDVDNDINYTYNELNDRSNRLANYFKHELSIVKGDRVAYISRNRIELIEGYYATGKVGAMMIPYNARLSANELIQLINSETPKVLFYEDIYEDLISSIKDQ